MRVAVFLPIIALLAIIQVTWSEHFAVNAVVPQLLLAFLIILTLREGRKKGLIWAFVGGLIYTVFSPFPFSGDLIALLAAIGIIGLLGETVFGTTSPLTMMGQTAIATAVFVVVRVLLANLAAQFWGVPLHLSWDTEVVYLLWLIIYQIGLVWLFYFAWEWISQKVVGWQQRPGLKRSRFL